MFNGDGASGWGGGRALGTVLLVASTVSALNAPDSWPHTTEMGDTTPYTGFPGGAGGKEPTRQCRRHKKHGVRSLGWEDPLEKGMATHSSILAWRIPSTEEPGEPQSMGSQCQTRLRDQACVHVAHTLLNKTITEKEASIYSAAAAAKSLQSCPTLCDPIDGCPPGSPVPGILQARVLEWGAIAFSIYRTAPKSSNKNLTSRFV